jgi:hypothetical protein
VVPDRTGGSVLIRVYHVTLPTGLDVVAHRVASGELYIVVSDQLAPGEQRAAVRSAIRAARRQAWDFGFLPLPLAAGLAAHTAVRHVSAAVRAHGAIAAITGAATAAAGAVAAAVLVTAAPAVHPQHGAIGPPPPGYSQSATPGSHPVPGSGPGRSAPGASGQPPGSTQRVITVATPRTAPQPSPQPKPSASTSQPGPAPTTTSPVTTSPTPQPTTTSPSSSPPSKSGGPKTCVIVLGITVCL